MSTAVKPTAGVQGLSDVKQTMRATLEAILLLLVGYSSLTDGLSKLTHKIQFTILHYTHTSRVQSLTRCTMSKTTTLHTSRCRGCSVDGTLYSAIQNSQILILFSYEYASGQIKLSQTYVHAETHIIIRVNSHLACIHPSFSLQCRPGPPPLRLPGGLCPWLQTVRSVLHRPRVWEALFCLV